MGGDFRNQVCALHDIFKISERYLDFDRYPVSSTSEWSDRIKVVLFSIHFIFILKNRRSRNRFFDIIKYMLLQMGVYHQLTALLR